MSEPVNENSNNEITKRISIPLFECSLALGIAQNTAENLMKRAGTNEFAPQLKELAEWLVTCSQGIAKLTETLDTIFDLGSKKPDQHRE